MGWLDRFFRERRALLGTNEPERAFAPDPSADSWPLAGGGDNEATIEFIRREGLSLVSVATGDIRPISAFAGGTILLATTWEPYSATTIGSLRGGVDAGEIEPFGVVFFEESRETVAASKSTAWYFSRAYVLAPQSSPLLSLIGRVPIQLNVGASGTLASIVEGKA